MRAPASATPVIMLTAALLSAACATPARSLAAAASPEPPSAALAVATPDPPEADVEAEPPRSLATFEEELARRVNVIKGDREAHEHELLEEWMPSEPTPPAVATNWRLDIQEKGTFLPVTREIIVLADGTWRESVGLVQRPPTIRTGKLDASMLARLAAFVAAQRVTPAKKPARKPQGQGADGYTSGRIVYDAPDRMVVVQEGKTRRVLRTALAVTGQWEPLHAIVEGTSLLLQTTKANAAP